MYVRMSYIQKKREDGEKKLCVKALTFVLSEPDSVKKSLCRACY
jgi:hypothetical protein